MCDVRCRPSGFSSTPRFLPPPGEGVSPSPHSARFFDVVESSAACQHFTLTCRLSEMGGKVLSAERFRRIAHIFMITLGSHASKASWQLEHIVDKRRQLGVGKLRQFARIGRPPPLTRLRVVRLLAAARPGCLCGWCGSCRRGGGHAGLAATRLLGRPLLLHGCGSRWLVTEAQRRLNERHHCG